MKPLSAPRAVPAEATPTTDSGSGPPKKNAYDTTPPPALLQFMVENWRPPVSKLPSRIKGHETFLGRRRALSARFPGEALVIPTGHEKIRANDTTYRFRPGTDFYYLTGNLEPDCALVMVPEGDGHRDVLFVEPNPGKSDATFFTDRSKGELWVGPRLGVAQSQARYGVHQARPLPELKATLESFLGQKVRVLRGLDGRVDGLLPAPPSAEPVPVAPAPNVEPNEGTEPKPPKPPTPDRELASFLSEMRLVKDTQEIAELRKAVASTKRGFEDVIRALPSLTNEREVEGVFNLRARVEGNDVGYNTIAASGAHACILHWVENHGALRKRDLLLLDAGVEAHTLYTADITRTLPIGGEFSKEQRTIYELVAQAQDAALAAVKPGNDFMAPNAAAMKVLAEGLERLKILTMSAAEALLEEKQFYKRYSLHNVSHMLGLDVHDCAQARMEAYKFGKLRVGMVLTVEPGLYFQLDDLTVPARYRGIGVRIEDDVVVTDKGCSVLSQGIPRAAEDVEAWMASLWKKKGSRR